MILVVRKRRSTRRNTKHEKQHESTTMNRPDASNDPSNSTGSVFVLGLEGCGLFYLPESREIVSRLETVTAIDRTTTGASESREN